jgi:hypothetical protein
MFRENFLRGLPPFQVLRHREQKTTALYAKVDRIALGGLVRPWPSLGGVA